MWPFTVGKTFVLVNSSFGAVKVTKNTDFDKYKYFGGYDTGFDALLSDGSGFRKNIIIFGAQVSSFVHIDNKKERYPGSWERRNTWFR